MQPRKHRALLTILTLADALLRTLGVNWPVSHWNILSPWPGAPVSDVLELL